MFARIARFRIREYEIYFYRLKVKQRPELRGWDHFLAKYTWLCPTSDWDIWVCDWVCDGRVKSVKSNSDPWVSAPNKSVSSVSRKVRVCELIPYASTLILILYLTTPICNCNVCPICDWPCVLFCLVSRKFIALKMARVLTRHSPFHTFAYYVIGNHMSAQWIFSDLDICKYLSSLVSGPIDRLPLRSSIIGKRKGAGTSLIFVRQLKYIRQRTPPDGGTCARRCKGCILLSPCHTIRHQQNNDIIIMGDLNSKIKISKNTCQQQSSRNGKLLEEFIKQTQTTIVNTKPEHKGTWFHGKIRRKHT